MGGGASDRRATAASGVAPRASTALGSASMSVDESQRSKPSSRCTTASWPACSSAMAMKHDESTCARRARRVRLPLVIT